MQNYPQNPPIYSHMPVGVPNHFTPDQHPIHPHFPVGVVHGVAAYQHPAFTQFSPLPFNQIASANPQVQYGRVAPRQVPVETVQLTPTHQQGYTHSFGSFRPPRFVNSPVFHGPLINQGVFNHPLATNHQPYEVPVASSSSSPVHGSCHMQTHSQTKPHFQIQPHFQTQLSDDVPSPSYDQIKSKAFEAAPTGPNKDLGSESPCRKEIISESDDDSKELEEYVHNFMSYRAQLHRSLGLNSKRVGGRRLNKRRNAAVSKAPISARKKVRKCALKEAGATEDELLEEQMQLFSEDFKSAPPFAQEKALEIIAKILNGQL
ncbi:hypothetical protein OXX59_001150 [Metschnikowia pulcherrima]